MRSLDYFSSITLAPMFSVGVSYDDEGNPVWQLLKADFEDITQEEARL